MAVLTWDQTGERTYETGVDHGVLYVYDKSKKAYDNGVAWNGLTNVTMSPSGADASDFYADNIKYLTLRGAENFGATIEAYTYPDEFEVCDGSAPVGVAGITLNQQPRSAFGFVCRTKVGDDTGSEDYKIHIIWNATASPSERAYASVNDSPEPITFSWEITTTSTPFSTFTQFQPVSHITVDSRHFATEELKAKLTALEEMLFGSASGQATLPTPDVVLTTLGVTAA